MEENKLNAVRVVAIGGSAGSLQIVLKIVPLLSPGMNVCVILVMHRKSNEDNVLSDVISARTGLRVREIEDKDAIEAGVIFLAPPDYHVLLEKDGTFTLDDSEKVHFSRPSIDVTFESVAEVCRENLICVLLSGANSDGAEGLRTARALGATIVIQDPDTADVPYMPKQAMEIVEPDMLLSESNLIDFVDLVNR